MHSIAFQQWFAEIPCACRPTEQRYKKNCLARAYSRCLTSTHMQYACSAHIKQTTCQH